MMVVFTIQNLNDASRTEQDDLAALINTVK